jgi:hypothetical protein
MNVVIYKKARQVSGSRVVCTQPVFSKGASSTDQSLIAARNSIVAENNYGQSGPTSTENGKTTTPGIERIDVNRSGRGCHRKWHSGEIAPSVVPKLSIETGLVYTYTKPRRSDDSDPWYFTGIDFCTGRTDFRRLAGTGLGYNNNFAPVTLGPDGSAYVGALGGLIRLADAKPPKGPARSSPKGCNPKPRLKLSLRFRHGRRGCARGPVSAGIGGADRRRIRRAGFYLGKRKVAKDARYPFRRRVDSGRHVGKAHRHVVTARIRMKDGKKATLRRRFKVCAR